MTMIVHNHQFSSSTQDAAIARASLQAMLRRKHNEQPLTFRTVDSGGDSETDTGADRKQATDTGADRGHGEAIAIPASAVALLIDILEAMVAGHGVTIIPQHAELTTLQAADVLNVSRPFLIKLLEAGEIPYRKVGRHRRVLMEDVMAYKIDNDQKREAILDQLIKESQELGVGYDD